MQESKREERKKLADEDAQIKIKKLEEQAYTLQRQVACQKQVDHTSIFYGFWYAIYKKIKTLINLGVELWFVKDLARELFCYLY